MKTRFTYLLIILFVFLFAENSYSQRRIAVYVQNGSATTNIQWAKMTHLVYSFLNPTTGTSGDIATGGVANAATSSGVWFTTSNFTTMIAAARTANPSIKIIISTGGAPTTNDPNITANLNSILANSTQSAALADDIRDFIQHYNLDGWDFDLEHPTTTAQKNNHETFLSMMRTRLDAIETAMCKPLEISIALNGETDHFVVNPTGSDYVNPTVDPYVDFYHLMTYDASYAAHNAINPSWPLDHSPLIMAQEAVRDFSNPPFNWSKSKMMIGIPFYGKNGSTTPFYNSINSSLSSTIYTSDFSGGFNYNGCNTITAKVNFALSSGLAGVIVWEGSEDLNNSTGYSLASCLYSAMGAAPAWEQTCCEKPNLGNDILTCNTPLPVTLNANTTTSGSPTYSWTMIAPSNTVINASGSVTQSVNAVGTYVVKRTSGTCSRTDTVIVSSTALPTPNLGADRSLCTVPYILQPSNTSSFPSGTTFQWKKNGSDITGEISTTLYASVPATYTLVASLSGCTSTSDDIVITSSSATPVDACRTTAGTLTLKVTGGTGPFTWYSSDLPGNTVVGTGTSFTTPSLPLPSTTYYYVEDAGAITTYTVGETAIPTGFANNVTDPFSYTGISMEFDVKNPVNIQSVSVYAYGAAAYPFSFAIDIFNDNNDIVYTSPTTTYNVWPGAAFQVITLNAHLPVGKYRMEAVKSGGTNIPSFFHHNTSAFTYGSALDLSITREIGVSQYGPFYSWVIGEYNGCPRIPVRAEVATSCSPIFLPVELIYFNAEKNENNVLLEWATSSERDNNYFGIERSSDGIHFTQIGTVNGNRNSQNKQDYSYADLNVPKEILYYRLAQYDLDGKVSYSSIKTVNNSSDMELSVAPNPFTNTTSLFIAGAKGLVQIKVLDLQGKILQSFSKDAGEEIIVGNNLSAGFYIIEATNNSSVVKYKVVKE